ncbi:LD-carboxypeptidase [Carboxylicivirga sp. M1479]|uniref:S66 peptidase family protein n=1 Tax=Carboxylicivirga sp. M1479 TaxID=2594476 RepID=UPI001178CA55|nr:LD-carboxypeptidase [Carboxylicivirga sp. M1479]TRX72396.1 LD-carboxypeptidase [Carboxylicivirga sp. M1479]
MIFPKSLEKGSTIGIIAPAGKIDAETIHFAEKLLHKRGYKVVIGDNVHNTFHQYAGNDEHRTADLQHMLNSRDIDAIFCARGGYGTIRIIDEIDFTHFLEYPKWIIGYSDITVLHAALQNKVGVASIHGPMPKNFPDKDEDEEDMEALFNMLHGEMPCYVIKPHCLNRKGEASGLLIGGNLSLIQALRATDLDPNPHGKIMFIEDLSEYLYHLDRMMQNLKLSGFLKELSGIVVGDFTDMKDNDDPYGQSALEIIKEAVAEYDYPVMFGFPAGHNHLNLPLVLGKRVALKVDDEECKLEF